MEKLTLNGITLEVADDRERMIREWRMNPENWEKPWPGFVEIHKLEGLLIEADIPYQKIVYSGGWQVCYINADGTKAGDAIEHTGSYGNANDLLEVAGFDVEDVVGWLTAQEAFEYFKRYHETRKKN